MTDEVEVTAIEKPVFIIGSPRSGTSVLAWALAQHPSFWTSGETDFLFHLFGQSRIDEAWKTSGIEGGWLARHGVTRAEFAAALGLGINALITKRSAGKRWVDQSPTYTAIVDTIAELFPGALFVHIMRDGRNVVQSMIRSGFNTPWATDFEDACRTWAWFVDKAVAFGTKSPERYLALPYELMSESPQTCFSSVLDFLDAEFDEAPAEFVSTRRINSSYQADGPRVGQYLGPPSPWNDWTKEQRQKFIEVAGPTFLEQRFGKEEELAA